MLRRITVINYQRVSSFLVPCVRRIHDASTPVEAKDAEEIRIPVPWGHIAGKWWGRKDTKPLVGLHGWQDNAGTWDRLAPLLTPEVSILALDGPGHGYSSPMPAGLPYRITDQLFVMRHIVNHFKWDTMSILAHSMGAVQSFVYSAIYPDEVENLILIDAFKPLSVDPEKEIAKIAKGIDMYLEAETLVDETKPSYSYDEMVERLYHGMVGRSLTKDSCKILLRRGIEKRGEGYTFRRDSRIKVGRLGGWLHEYVLYIASQIECNVLFIKADPGLVIESQEINTETLETMKKAAKVFEYHTVEGLHHVHLNNPERVAPLILNFLKSHKSDSTDVPSDSFKQVTNTPLTFL